MIETRQETAGILRKAAKVMLEGGYVAQIRYGEDGSSSEGNYKPGAHCALGAIEVAAGMRPYQANPTTPAVIALATALDPAKVLKLSPSGVVADWNNAHGMSAKKVACVMNAAAEEMEEENGATPEDA